MAETYEYTAYNSDTMEMGDRTPKEPRKKRRRGGHWLRDLLILILLLAAILFCLWKLLVQATAGAGESRDGCYTFLIAGTDGDGTRTDTVMLVYVDTETDELSLLSIPRDTLVDLDMSVPKLNGVYGAYGGEEEGMEALMDQVELLLGYRPDGYVLVNFEAVEQVVDILGGVEFDVPVDMYYTDPAQDLYIDLEAGVQTLTGEQALWVLRYREGYALADLDRVAVQRELVQAVAGQCLRLSNVTKLPQLLTVYNQQVLSDLSFGNLVYLAAAILQCDVENANMDTLPGESVWYQSGSYYQVDAEAAAALLNESYNPLDREITTADLYVVNVVDGQLTVVGTTSSSAASDETDGAQENSSAASSSAAPSTPAESAVSSVSQEPASNTPAEASEPVQETERETPEADEAPEPSASAEAEQEPSDEPSAGPSADAAQPEDAQSPEEPSQAPEEGQLEQAEILPTD